MAKDLREILLSMRVDQRCSEHPVRLRAAKGVTPDSEAVSARKGAARSPRSKVYFFPSTNARHTTAVASNFRTL